MPFFPTQIFSQTNPSAGSLRAAPTSPSAEVSAINNELAALETALGVNFTALASLVLEFSNKRIDARVSPVNAPSASQTVNTDLYDAVSFTGVSNSVTITTSGTPKLGDFLVLWFTDAGSSQSLSFSTKFTATTIGLPSSTKGGSTLRTTMTTAWNPATSLWECVGVA